jgi:hypothetical protein
MNELEKWVMGEMIDKLQEFEGVKAYPSDLAYMLFEEANCNGSYTFSTFEAVQWCNKYFEQLGDVVEDYSSDFGEPPSNVFLFPERFQVEIILFVASNLVGLSEYVTERIDNDDEFILTSSVIETIAKEWQEAMN